VTVEIALKSALTAISAGTGRPNLNKIIPKEK